MSVIIYCCWLFLIDRLFPWRKIAVMEGGVEHLKHVTILSYFNNVFCQNELKIADKSCKHSGFISIPRSTHPTTVLVAKC